MKCILSLSTKGGTGKTLVASNIAKKLSEEGKEVAIIDADLDSSNILEVMGIPDGKHDIDKKRKFKPLRKDRIDIFSMSGILNDITDSVSKSGKEKAQIIQDVVLNTDWGVSKEAYFIVDMPAGSGSIWKAVRRLFGNDIIGAVIVTTPSTVVDAERSYNLCSKNKVRILGVVENMGKFTCPECGETYYPFGKDEGKEFADKHNLNFFGTIPIMPDEDEKNFDGTIDNIIEEVDSFEG